MDSIKRNKKEVDEQIDDAIKHNLIKTLKEILPLLPKEATERAEKQNATNVGIKITLVDPKATTPPTFMMEDN